MVTQKMIQVRIYRAIEFYLWLKEKEIIANITLGVSILATDDRAVLSNEFNNEIPKGYENCTLFWICEMRGEIDISVMKDYEQWSPRWVNN